MEEKKTHYFVIIDGVEHELDVENVCFNKNSISLRISSNSILNNPIGEFIFGVNIRSSSVSGRIILNPIVMVYNFLKCNIINIIDKTYIIKFESYNTRKIHE